MIANTHSRWERANMYHNLFDLKSIRIPPINTEEREEYYKSNFGPLKVIGIPGLGKDPQIEVLVYEPFTKRSYYTLVTNGMSDYIQNMPPALSEHAAKRTELIMYVRKPEKWMFELLKNVAQLTINEGKYLHWWHALGGKSPIDGANSKFSHCYFLPPYFEDEGFNPMMVQGEKVDFLWVIPISDRELVYMMENGPESLEEAMKEADMDPLFNPNRKAFI